MEALRELPSAGIRLRTRALTTTMFARNLLGDLFLHGIGGAKYDELGDEIARVFYDAAPPAFLTLSLTLHLGLEHPPVGRPDLDAIGRRINDLTWQPERWLDGRPEYAPPIAEKRRLIAEAPTSKADRLARYRAFRRINGQLAAAEQVAGLREGLGAERAAMLGALKEAEVARSREFSIVLFPEPRIRAAMEGVAAQLGG